MVDIFPIGDLHISTKDEVIKFVDYLNQRPEKVLILLGDIIHFAHSFWSPDFTAEMEEKEIKKAMKEDFNLWVNFFRQLKKFSLMYYGTHEMFVNEICMIKEWPLPKLPSKINKLVLVPPDCHEIELEDLRVTGLHAPANIYPQSSPKFKVRKESVEKQLEKILQDFDPRKPEKTIFCSHDPTDYYYTNMGYTVLRKLLEKFHFKIHYHAHIHSNLREHVVGVTPTVNKSILALYQFKREALEPLPESLNLLLAQKFKER